MELALIAIATLWGLAIGSFLNVAILRSPTRESLRGRSRCNACLHTLTARELIPIISFVVQKARCRSCGTVLLWQYPIVEFATASLFGLITAFYLNAIGHSLQLFDIIILATLFTTASAMIVICIADLKFHLIPNGATSALIVVGLVLSYSRAIPTYNLVYDITTAIIIAGFLASLWFFSKGKWMGLGDAKLVIGTSLLVGFPNAIVALLFAFWLGSVVGIFLLLLNRAALKDLIPFGPFILAGAILSYFFTDQFLSLMGLYMVFTM